MLVLRVKSVSSLGLKDQRIGVCFCGECWVEDFGCIAEPIYGSLSEAVKMGSFSFMFFHDRTVLLRAKHGA